MPWFVIVGFPLGAGCKRDGLWLHGLQLERRLCALVCFCRVSRVELGLAVGVEPGAARPSARSGMGLPGDVG